MVYVLHQKQLIPVVVRCGLLNISQDDCGGVEQLQGLETQDGIYGVPSRLLKIVPIYC